VSRKTINIEESIYFILKDFCKENGIVIGKLVEKIIIEYVKLNKVKIKK
jgi:hypothetical protein